MLECIKFILEYVAKFCAMLFTIDIGNNMSLGLLLCILFIFLPTLFRVLTIISHNVIDELDLIALDKKQEKKGRGN